MFRSAVEPVNDDVLAQLWAKRCFLVDEDTVNLSMDAHVMQGVEEELYGRLHLYYEGLAAKRKTKKREKQQRRNIISAENKHGYGRGAAAPDKDDPYAGDMSDGEKEYYHGKKW